LLAVAQMFEALNEIFRNKINVKIDHLELSLLNSVNLLKNPMPLCGPCGIIHVPDVNSLFLSPVPSPSTCVIVVEPVLIL